MCQECWDKLDLMSQEEKDALARKHESVTAKSVNEVIKATQDLLKNSRDRHEALMGQTLSIIESVNDMKFQDKLYGPMVNRFGAPKWEVALCTTLAECLVRLAEHENERENASNPQTT